MRKFVSEHLPKFDAGDLKEVPSSSGGMSPFLKFLNAEGKEAEQVRLSLSPSLSLSESCGSALKRPALTRPSSGVSLSLFQL